MSEYIFIALFEKLLKQKKETKMLKAKFFSLIDKKTNKEVYTSPCYLREDNETVDYYKVFDVFKFYFDRINSGIKQQMDSPRLTEDQKKQLHFIAPNGYLIALRELTNCGGYHTTQYWIKELSDYSDIKEYSYTNEL